LARDGIRVRQIGQTIIEILGGKKIHPAWAVPGGVNKPLAPPTATKCSPCFPKPWRSAQRTLQWYKRIAG
jgi:NAD-reducing hydrogenase large subunit